MLVLPCLSVAKAGGLYDAWLPLDCWGRPQAVYWCLASWLQRREDCVAAGCLWAAEAGLARLLGD